MLYAGDPAQYASLADPSDFERNMRRAGADERYRVLFEWSEGRTLDQIDAISLVAATAPDVLVLSPYLSLLAAEIAEAYPDLPIVAFAAAEQLTSVATITRVLVSYEAGLREAGAFLAEWVSGGPDRSVVLIVSSGGIPNTGSADDRQAIESSYMEAAGVPVSTVEVPARPTRESVRAAVQRIETTENTAVVVLLDGVAAGWALEFLQTEPVWLVLRGAVRPDGPLNVLATVHADPASGVAEALGNPGTTVTTPARLTVVGAAGQ
jgi:DNA-binding LacI/PurR family transcriptional regulator